jgi:hypothetical protein
MFNHLNLPANVFKIHVLLSILYDITYMMLKEKRLNIICREILAQLLQFSYFCYMYYCT